VIPAQYRCMRCGLKWSGSRFLWGDDGRAKQYDDYGMVECPAPSCKSIYVEWVNWQKCLKALGRYWND